MDVTMIKTREQNPKVKPYLVDVPVTVMIWSRCELQKKQFDIIRKARPSILFFVSDGGRNKEEHNKILKSREYVKNIDWDCTVYRLYWNTNQGMYSIFSQTQKFIWSKVERLIFLEDDIMPSVSFFSYCAELLEKYKDDTRIAAINGMNHLTEYGDMKADYFFSKVGSIWGFATWKRVYDSFGNFDYKYDNYVIREVCKNAKKDTYFCKAMRGYARKERFDGHVAGPEFYFVLNIFAQNQLFIIPKYNMISCEGCVEGSTHASNDIRKLAKGDAQIFNMKTYELNRPLIHAKYVFPDTTYEEKQKRLTAWHHPIVSSYRRIVYIGKCIYYGDSIRLMKRAKQKIKNKVLGVKRYEN